ncbi:Centromere-associated protein E [Araneus ventricosus]|uniref:Centromere-associated protein E n=1 Tax=Araneus ventricosus TaxID=182803 RepID=A0A4Y2FVW8_ARAVE|nr:Centromere-associated protein E [Araneus ventricosus]
MFWLFGVYMKSGEIEKNEIYWKAEPPTTICQITTSEKPAAYSFDHVFDSKVENEYIYQEICSGIVRSVVDGFNGTIFAYGQTSSGKTFTMLGDKEKNVQGIMHYAVEDIFDLIQNMTNREFLLRVSYMEIYNETVRDLLTGEDNLKLQEENGQIKVNGLQEKLVQKPEQILHFIKNGECHRRTRETRMNEKSSRSHAIFRMIIESCVRGVEDAAVSVSQFNLVDLAGSERARHTGATGTRFKESVKINQSLLSLGQVIRQLSENENQFISYRDSKLTRILQNSLGGNSLTAIICTVTAACLDETQSTLKFAEQAKHIRNTPQVNEVLTEQALLKQYANKIKKLTAELEATKEEKSQQNRNLQEKIKYLEKQFVFQMNPLKAKSNRRETWGGTLDAARFRLQITSQNSFKNRTSFSRSRVGSCNLSILEEQCEDADGDEMFFPHQSAQQLKGSKRSSNSKRNSSLLPTADVAVQVEPVALCFSPKLPESECDEMKMMAERISYLEKELAELREFTTLERQIMESCSSSLDVCKAKNSISASDEGFPSHSESFSTNFHTSIFEEMEQRNAINEDSIFSPSGTSSIRFNEKKDDLFQYLESTMKMMGMRKNIDFPSASNDLNNNYKITLEMFYLILQYQCLTFKGCFKSEICKKIDGVLFNLRDVFKSFSDQTTSDETIENLINNFINQTDYLLKEIEMVSLDSDVDDKNEIINQSRPFDSIIGLSSFEKSPHILRNKNEIGKNNCTENMNMSSSLYKDGSIEENAANSVCDCEKLKSTIAALEKDIEVYENSFSVANSNKEEMKDKIAALEKQIEIYQTSTSDPDSENKKMKDKIVCLEKDIEVHLKTISDYKYDSNLKDKQITILKDKIEIQKQMIDSFENELTLKDKPECKCSLEVVSSIVPNNNTNSLITFKDQASQVAYMEGISLSSGLDESNVSERYASNLSMDLSSNCDRSINESKVSVNEQHSEEVCQQTSQILPLTNSEKENWGEQLKTSFEATLKDLTELKLFTLEFMKRDMKKEYLVDMGSFDEQLDYPLTDQMKVEVTALKEMLLRLEFYLHARSDVEKNLTDFLESKLVEISVLEDKLAESESATKNKEADFDKLECALLSIEENVSELVQKLKSLGCVEDNINCFELEDDTTFSLHSNKSLNCIASIQRMVLEIDELINKTTVSVNDLSVKLKETQDNLNSLQSRHKETKSVQTVNDYDYLDLTQKLKEAEASTEKLDSEIKNLKSKLEILTKENDCLREELGRKTNFYDTKIEDMKIKFDAEKEEWDSKCVKETEEKYYRMIMDQESKFLEEKHQTELDFYKQISDYEKKLADQFDQLQEENRNNITDLKSKLNAEIEERYREKMKLDDKIRAREKDLTQYREYNSYLKSKCRELAVELKRCKEKAKSFEQKDNVLQEKNNEKSVDYKQTQTDDNRLEDNVSSSPDLCNQCKVFMQKISDLEAVHQSTVKKSEVLLAKLQNDLEAKKAKILSLDANNAKMVQEIVALRKELTTKSTLLPFCQCRGLACKVAEAQNSGKLESTEKGKAINLNPKNDKEKPTYLRDNLNSQDILQMEIVQDAIKKAREELTELLLAGGGGSGPANSMQCYYLQAKLNKKTRELDSLKTEMAKLKKHPLKQGFEVTNGSYKDIKGVEGNIFTPYTNPNNPLPEGEALHPKMQRRKVLKETNRKHVAPFPTSKEEMREERISDGKAYHYYFSSVSN